MKWKAQCPSRPPPPRPSGPILARASPPSQALHGPPAMVASPSPNLHLPYPSHYMGAMTGSYGYYPMPVPVPYSTPHHGHGSACSHYSYRYQPPHHSPFWGSSNPGTTPVAHWPHHRPITPSAATSSSTNKHLLTSSTSKKDRPVGVRLTVNKSEPSSDEALTRLGRFFGPASPEVDQIIVAAIFLFLSTDDLAKAHVVCKQWNHVTKIAFYSQSPH